MTLPRRIQNFPIIRKHSNISNDISSNDLDVHSCPLDNHRHYFHPSTTIENKKNTPTLSYNEETSEESSIETHSTTNNNGRLRLLCTRLKQRFSLSKEHRFHSEDKHIHMATRSKNYKSISSSTVDSNSEFEWPDFEKIYDSLPFCLVKDLPGFNDPSYGELDVDVFDASTLLIDEANEQQNSFNNCQRGVQFRRHAICHKLDKSQYNSQLDTFAQQLMVEKLLRTWT